MRDHRQIVGDQHEGELALAAQAHQEVQDLGLDGYVERRCRLVEQQNARLEHQRAGDRDPLALAAGELVGIAEAEAGPEADIAQDRLDPPLDITNAVDGHGLGEDPVDRVPRMQRAVGILEDHLHELVEGLPALGPLRLAGHHDVARPAWIEP